LCKITPLVNLVNKVNNMNKSYKTLVIRALILVVVIVVAGLLISNNNKSENYLQSASKIKVGILTMTTGNLAFLGENIVDSAKLAAEKLGRTNDVEFIVEDVGNLSVQGTEAVAAARKLIDVDHVQFIIDGMASNGTLASAPVINEAKVVMITPLTGGQNIDEAGEYIFRNGPSDILGATLPARDFTQKFAFKRVALMTDNADYTLDIRNNFEKAFTGTIASDQLIKPDGVDYRIELLKAKVAKPDVLFINTATGVSARYVIKQARELGITVPIVTNFLAYGPDLISLAGKSAEEVYVYDPEYNESSRDVAALLSDYKSKYGHESPIAFHTTGTYDALRMGLQAIDAVGYDGQKIHDYLLTNIQGWSGMNGIVSFNSQGNSGTGFILKQIRNGKLEVVKGIN